MLKVEKPSIDTTFSPRARSPGLSMDALAPELPSTPAPAIGSEKIKLPNMAEASAYQQIVEGMDRDLRTDSIYNESPIAKGKAKKPKRNSTLGIMLNSAKDLIYSASSSNQRDARSPASDIVDPGSDTKVDLTPPRQDQAFLREELAETKQKLHESQKIVTELLTIVKKMASDDGTKDQLDKLLTRAYRNMMPSS